jgi:hypothetical protein
LEFFFFQKKKQKAFVLLRRRFVDPELGESTLRVLSVKSSLLGLFFFQKKKQKAFVLLRRRFLNPELGKADSGSLRACSQETNWFVRILSVCSVSQKVP